MKFSLFLTFLHFLPMLQKNYVCWRVAKNYTFAGVFTFAGEVLYVYG